MKIHHLTHPVHGRCTVDERQLPEFQALGWTLPAAAAGGEDHSPQPSPAAAPIPSQDPQPEAPPAADLPPQPEPPAQPAAPAKVDIPAELVELCTLSAIGPQKAARLVSEHGIRTRAELYRAIDQVDTKQRLLDDTALKLGPRILESLARQTYDDAHPQAAEDHG